jgi:hypothetical protein
MELDASVVRHRDLGGVSTLSRPVLSLPPRVGDQGSDHDHSVGALLKVLLG